MSNDSSPIIAPADTAGKQPEFSADDIEIVKAAWCALGKKRKPHDVLLSNAVQRIAAYAYARGIAHGESAEARPLSTYPNGNVPDDLERGGVAVEATVQDLGEFFEEQANGPPRKKKQPPFLTPSATSNGRNQAIDIDTSRGVGWISLDCDEAGMSALLEAHIGALAYALHETPSGKPDKWRVWIPLRHAWLPDAVLVEAERTGAAAHHSTRFEEAWHQRYRAARLIFGALGELKGAGFDPSTCSPTNAFFPGHPTPEQPGSRRVTWSNGLSFDLEAAFAALVELGVVVAAGPRDSKPRTRRALNPSELISKEHLAAAVEPIAAAINAIPYVGHPLYMALNGSLINAGVPLDCLAGFVGQICAAAGDPQVEDRIRGANWSIDRHENNQPYSTLSRDFPSIAAAVHDALPETPARTAARVIENAPKPAVRVSADVARASVRAAFENIVLGDTVLLKDSAGSGKSTTGAQCIAERKTQYIVLVRDYKTATDWKARLDFRRVNSTVLRSVLRVLNDNGKPECQFPKQVEAAYRAGLNPRAVLCRGRQGKKVVGEKCSYLEACPASEPDEPVGSVLIATHAMAPHALSSKGWEYATLVIDETPSEMVSQTEITPTMLRRAIPGRGAFAETDPLCRATRKVSTTVALAIVERALADVIEGPGPVNATVLATRMHERWDEDHWLWTGVDKDHGKIFRGRKKRPPTMPEILNGGFKLLCRALFRTDELFVPNDIGSTRRGTAQLSAEAWQAHHAVRAIVAKYAMGIADDDLKTEMERHAASVIEHEPGQALHVARIAPHIDAMAAHRGSIIILDGTGDGVALGAALRRTIPTVQHVAQELADVKRLILASGEANMSKWCPKNRVSWKPSLKTALREVVKTILTDAPKGARVALATFRPIAEQLEAAWKDGTGEAAALLAPLRAHISELRIVYYGSEVTRGSNDLKDFDVTVGLGNGIPNVTNANIVARTLGVPEGAYKDACVALGQWHDRLRGVPRAGAKLLSIQVGTLWPAGGQWDAESTNVVEMPIGRPNGDRDVAKTTRELVAATGSIARAAKAAAVSVGSVFKATTRPVTAEVADKLEAALERIRQSAPITGVHPVAGADFDGEQCPTVA